MMNAKNMVMSTQSIEGVAVKKANIHTKNGVMHITTAPLPYEYNLYEALNDLPTMSAAGQQLRKYEEDYFDAENSVSSGIVEGVPVYVDSVIIERNKMLSSIGYINNEDSTYWVVAPRSEGWQKVWDNTKEYFKYDEKVLKRDSLQEYWTTRALMDDAVFNMTDQKNVNDSLVSVPYLTWRKYWVKDKPYFHKFDKPFAPGGLLYGADSVKCSNGVLFEVDEWPFTPEQTWLKEIWVETENLSLNTGGKDCTVISRRQVADSISSDGFLQIVPRTATSNWEAYFKLDNTLAADYDICAVILPRAVAGLENAKPCKFKATLNYVDESGASKSFDFDNTQFTSDPERVDTVVLAEGFHMPVCNYGQNDIKFTLKLQCSIRTTETSRYSREMYLDCIYLRPRTSKSEEQ
jgi:hypothetical protein